jgi:antitoxin Phd
MATWQVQEAKARLSEVIERAQTEGPQTISRHGEERAVMVSAREYKRLAARKPDLREILLGGPKVPGGFNIRRSRDTGSRRKIVL